MAPIERLPFDVVHAIVALVGTHDLPAVALVSRLFHAAATPRIFALVRHTHRLAKQWGQILSPLELLSARSDLLAHLKSLDIRAVPLYKGAPHPQFTRVCAHVVQSAPGLVSFSWATAGLYDAFLATLLRLLAPEARLTDRTRAGTAAGRQTDPHVPAPGPLVRLSLTEDGLSSSDALLLTRLGPIEHITLHKPSTGATRALVEWIASNPRLASLTISNNYSLDPPLLSRILANTPNLRSLSITNCLRIIPSALFSIINATAELGLESLAFSIPRDTDGDSLSATFPPLPTLRHITLMIDPPDEPIPDRHTHAPTDPLTQRLLRHVFKAIRGVKLYSLTLRLASPRTLAPKLLSALITTHADSLRRLNLFKLALAATGVANVLLHVPNLEQLSVELGGILDDLDLIIEALPGAQHLHTLIDTSPMIAPTSSVRRPTGPSKTQTRSRALTRAQVTQLLEAGPVLGNVVSQQRNWAKEYIWTAGRMEVGVSMRKVRAL